MHPRYFFGAFLLAAFFPARALANPEPATYDTRGLSLGLTGVSYLDNAAALALNPALLQGVDYFEVLAHSSPFLLRTQAPLQGPGTRVDSELGVAPVSSFFVAGRVAPRVVFGAGLYLEVIYGAKYQDVTMIDGESSNTMAEDLDVAFFSGDFSLGFSFRVSKKVNIGAALRLPFARLTVDVYQNLLAAVDLVGYGQVKATVGGVGFPSGRFGISYDPIDELSLGVAYRPYAKIPLSGSGKALGLPISGLEGGTFAESSWSLPHALQFGLAAKFLDQRLMIVLEERLQFHRAKRTGNDALRIDIELPPGLQPLVGSENLRVTIPLAWKTVHVTKLGVEYEVSDLLDVRGGANIGFSATPEPFAIFILPPPGRYWAMTLGLGFNWRAVSLDLATAVGGGKTTISPDVANSGPATFEGETIDLCSSEQVVRSGCAGTYKALVFGGSATLTFRLTKPVRK